MHDVFLLISQTKMVDVALGRKKPKQNKTKHSDERSHRKGFSEDERFCKHQPSNVNFKLKKLRSPPSINPVHVQPGIKVEMFDAWRNLARYGKKSRKMAENQNLKLNLLLLPWDDLLPLKAKAICQPRPLRHRENSRVSNQGSWRKVKGAMKGVRQKKRVWELVWFIDLKRIFA